MKYYKFHLFILLFFSFNVGFTTFDQKNVERFKTFDEYKLQAIPFTGSQERNVYVLIKERKDSIIVRLYNDLEKTITYINRGNYWYSKDSTILDVSENVWAIEHNKKYIYNDTILNYNYLLHYYGDSAVLGDSHIMIETKHSSLLLFNDHSISRKINEIDDESTQFMMLWRIVNDYENIYIRMKYPIVIYPTRSYDYYNKVIRNDSLYKYGTDKLKNNICLMDVRILNTLGEFDPEKGISIIHKIKREDRCR